jgi:hypothetical protein
MRTVYRLLGPLRRFGADRVDQACQQALACESVDVGLIARMRQRATQARPPAQLRLPNVSGGRLARDPDEFAVGRDEKAEHERRERDHGDDARAHTDAAPPQARPPCSIPSPERLALARPRQLSGAQFGELVLAEEADRRDRRSTALRARAARLGAAMTLQAWDDDAAGVYDRALWAPLCTLRFVDDARNVLILGPVGVGKTHLAHALGHSACRPRLRVHADRADRLFNGSKPPGSTTATTPSCAA